MIFNSINFAIFLPIVFALYWALNRAPLKLQNLFILSASYVFYGWWDYRFLALIFISSLADFIVGQNIVKASRKSTRKILLGISFSVNLGILGFFKYFNFFIESFADLLGLFGFHADFFTLNLILPVGISFYTFQTLSYSIDVYRGRVKPTRDPFAFFAFVGFFPQLVAGPIERAHNLLPQFQKRRTFDLDKARDGTRQMLWGFFKKIVVADNCGAQVDLIYANYPDMNGITVVIGTLLMMFQFYGDFSGYSDIAIGTARLFGFRLTQNFAFPFYSRNTAEFWRRWHMTMMSWFRDYVFIPMAGDFNNKFRLVWVYLVTFSLVGLWHGASWNFIIWGFINGVYFIPSLLLFTRGKQTPIAAQGRWRPNFTEVRQIAVTMSLIALTGLIFRAQNIEHILGLLGRVVFGNSTFGIDVSLMLPILFSAALYCFEWFQRDKQHGLQIDHFPMAVRWSVYVVIGLVILTFGAFNQNEFIYFQF